MSKQLATYMGQKYSGKGGLGCGLIRCHLESTLRAFSSIWPKSTTWLPSNQQCSPSIYTVRANGHSRLWSMALISRHAWTKGPMVMKCYVLGKGSLGDVWDNFLIVEKHPLPHIGARDGFQRWGWSCSWFTPGSERLHAPTPPRPPLPDFTPLLACLGGLNTGQTTFSLGHALFTAVLRQTPFYCGCTGTSGLTATATCFCGGIVHQTGIRDMPICWMH